MKSELETELDVITEGLEYLMQELLKVQQRLTSLEKRVNGNG